MMGSWHGFGGWGMGAGSLMTVLLWALVIAGIVALVRALSSGADRRRDDMPGRPGPSAQEIVKARYARGEIDRAEYEQKMRDLGP